MNYTRAFRLGSTFSALETEIDVKTFDSRFFIQKNGYFLQEFGVDLGYAFGMYIHGPYSPDLARDAYTLQEIEYAEVPVNTEVIKRMKVFVEHVDQVVSSNKSKKYWFELLASLHFLCKYGYPKIGSLGEAKSNRKLASFGDDLEKAFEILRKHKII